MICCYMFCLVIALAEYETLGLVNIHSANLTGHSAFTSNQQDLYLIYHLLRITTTVG